MTTAEKKEMDEKREEECKMAKQFHLGTIYVGHFYSCSAASDGGGNTQDTKDHKARREEGK